MSRNNPMIYLYEYGILGELVAYNAHASLVRYSIDGVEHEIMTLNEDFEIVEELDIGLDDYYD